MRTRRDRSRFLYRIKYCSWVKVNVLNLQLKQRCVVIFVIFNSSSKAGSGGIYMILTSLKRDLKYKSVLTRIVNWISLSFS